MKKILGLAAIISSFAFVGCGDDTGTGGASGSTGTGTVTSGGTTKATTSASSGSTKASSSASGNASSTASGGAGADFAVNFTNWPHVGLKFEAAIVSGQDVVQTQTTDGAATTTVNFTDIPDGMYKLHYYADVNDNDMCDDQPTDHVWERDLGVAGNTITINGQPLADIPHDGMWSDVCASFQ